MSEQSEPEVDEAPPVDPATADTIKRSWADELWYRGGPPYRGRP